MSSSKGPKEESRKRESHTVTQVKTRHLLNEKNKGKVVKKHGRALVML